MRRSNSRRRPGAILALAAAALPSPLLAHGASVPVGPGEKLFWLLLYLFALALPLLALAAIFQLLRSPRAEPRKIFGSTRLFEVFRAGVVVALATSELLWPLAILVVIQGVRERRAQQEPYAPGGDDDAPAEGRDPGPTGPWPPLQQALVAGLAFAACALLVLGLP